MQLILALGLLITLVGLSATLPTKESELFWVSTDSGKVIPALLHSQPPLSEQIQAIEENVVFWHHLIGDDEGREITPGCSDCTSNFVKGAPVIISAHGFGDSHKGKLGSRLRESLTKKQEPYNIILIDWSKLVQSPHYFYAVASIPKVGEYVARLVDFLVDEGIVSVENVHFVGHSLGAHIANDISANMKSGKLQRVYGLDPAMPMFDVKPDSERLSEHDGELVVVIHTSITFQGFAKRCGDADFYPNAGKHQPGCDDNMFGHCSHARCVELFAESITSSNAFSSCLCESWEQFEGGECACEQQALMGWDTPLSANGAFYLRTGGEAPYSL